MIHVNKHPSNSLPYVFIQVSNLLPVGYFSMHPIFFYPLIQYFRYWKSKANNKKCDTTPGGAILPRTSFSRKNKMAAAVAGRLTPVLHRKSLQLLPVTGRPKSAPCPASRFSDDVGGEPRPMRADSGAACTQNLLQSPRQLAERGEQSSGAQTDLGTTPVRLLPSRRICQYTAGPPFLLGESTA